MHAQAEVIGAPLAVGAAERLLSTLLYALAVHLVVILGVEFDLRVRVDGVVEPDLEITLVSPSAEPASKAADFLAQTANAGGGTREEVLLPTTRLAMQSTSDDPPAPEPVEQPEALRSPPQSQQTELATDRPAATKVAPKPGSQRNARPETLTPAQLIRDSIEYAQLAAQLSEQTQRYARRPRKTYVTAATKEYRYAAYMEAWRAKVERVGNLNYPEAARRAGVTGSLRLVVELDPDGGVRDVRVRRSSGQPVLDEAARRIVRLAEPYAPFPEDIRRDTDLLVIARTWVFEEGNRLSSR